ncbi:differentially expressed in FDCP 8 homolog isoform X2 [Haemaphysalis longicornis]
MHLILPKMNVGLIDAVKSTAGQLYNTVNSRLVGSQVPKDGFPHSSKSCTADDMKLIDAELGISEEHFSSSPEGLLRFSTIEELETAIEHCKEMILDSEENSERRKKLVIRLVQLRQKLQEIKDGPPEEKTEDVKIVMEHHFEPRAYERAQQYCEKCCGSIWGVLYGFYQCKNCNFKCHNKCLNSITRKCAYMQMQEKSEFVLEICPEQGLSAQAYRCAECGQNVFPQQGQPRRCEYTGRYYCSLCHWNSHAVVPARVLHNWDFEPRKVCRASLQFLRLMAKRPVLNIDKLNPMLFTFVEDLRHVKKLREDILRMKQYLTLCHAAQQQKLLLLLHKRQHFVEGSDLYSMQDLIDLHDGNLLGYLSQVHQVFLDHITKNCEGCRGRGYLCKLCNADEVIFPLGGDTFTCPDCSSVYHRECREKSPDPCPWCEWRARQQNKAVRHAVEMPSL